MLPSARPPSQRSGRLGLGIVGAGRVGPVLGLALAGAGHAIVGISAVSESSRERAQGMLPYVPILDVPTVVERSELVILAVPDAELPTLVAGLAATGTWKPGQIVLHTAPGFGIDVLAPAAAAGAIPLAVHPALDIGLVIGGHLEVPPIGRWWRCPPLPAHGRGCPAGGC